MNALRICVWGLPLCLVAVVIVAIVAGTGGWFDPLALDSPIVDLRARRVFSAGLAGASLGLAGTLMQSVLANEVADPYTLGLSSGAALGAVLSFAFFPGFEPSICAAFFAIAVALVFAKAQRHTENGNDLVIKGLLFGGVFSAATGLLLFLSPQAGTTRAAQNWLFGGFHSPPWGEILGMIAVLVIAFYWVSAKYASLDRLLFGRECAHALGEDVDTLNFQAQLITALLAASAVVAGGIIGFIGWMSPHLARYVVGAGHRQLVWSSALFGAIGLVLADLLARTLGAPRELPVGLITALLGAPLLVLWHKRKVVW